MFEEKNRTVQNANGTVQKANGTAQNANGTAQNANGTVQNANGTVQNANGKQLLSRFSGGWGVRSNFPPKLVTRGGSIYHLRQGCISSVEFL